MNCERSYFDNLTKNEAESLPAVLNEIKSFNCKKKIILEETDYETIESIKNFDCEIIYQNHKGYGDALRTGIQNVDTEYLCIFNADGSFDPIYLKEMLKNVKIAIMFLQQDIQMGAGVRMILF